MPVTDYSQSLEQAVRELGMTGASFAYWDGDELHLACAGVRNSATGDPVTADTVMHIGSITKIINTVLFLQLVDDGLLSLDDPVSAHLPELQLADPSALERLTCRMLVNHTSGLDCEMLPDHGPDRERIADLIERCAAIGQLHRPGEGVAYSNLGPCIAGRIVEKLRGASWYDLVRDRIFAPLGMDEALAHPQDLPLHRASVGDLWDFQAGRFVRTTRPFLPLSFAPCGTTVMTSARDLTVFGRAMAQGGVVAGGEPILSAARMREMATPTARIVTSDCDWGLGWRLLPGDVLFHAGGGPGVVAALHVHRPTGRVVALLTNCDRGGELWASMIDPIVASWTGRPLVPPRPALASPADLSPYAGVYGGNLARVAIAAGEGQLRLQVSTTWATYDRSDRPTPPVTLAAVGPDRFGAQAGCDPRTGDVVFCDPGPDGRMRILMWGSRMLLRLS